MPFRPAKQSGGLSNAGSGEVHTASSPVTLLAGHFTMLLTVLLPCVMSPRYVACC